MSNATRNRVERLLYGDFRIEDLNRIFSILRVKSHVGQSVVEIGNFIAHPDERERGLVTSAARDYFILARSITARYSTPLDLSDLPADIAQVLAASLKTSPRERIKQETGKDIKSAKATLQSLTAKITAGPSRKLSIRDPSREEASLFDCLMRVVTLRRHLMRISSSMILSTPS